MRSSVPVASTLDISQICAPPNHLTQCSLRSPLMEAGSGRIVLRKHGTEAAFSELSYVYPLKLLSPRLSPENASAVYVVSYGGGLVGGDRIQLSVVVDEGAALVILTQVRP